MGSTAVLLWVWLQIQSHTWQWWQKQSMPNPAADGSMVSLPPSRSFFALSIWWPMRERWGTRALSVAGWPLMRCNKCSQSLDSLDLSLTLLPLLITRCHLLPVQCRWSWRVDPSYLSMVKHLTSCHLPRQKLDSSALWVRWPASQQGCLAVFAEGQPESVFLTVSYSSWDPASNTFL